MKNYLIYETGEIFSSVKSLSDHFNVSSRYIYDCINNEEKSINGYHIFCESFNPDISKIKESKGTYIIRCVEEDMEFKSAREAARYFNIDHKSILKATENPEKTYKGFHWEKIKSKIKEFKSSNSAASYICYETGEVYSTISQASFKNNIHGNSIRLVLNNPNKTAGGYHWCTDLSVFDGIELSEGSNKKVYCFEREILFNSINEAEKFINKKGIGNVLDIPNKTCGGYHWCTDLNDFNRLLLSKNNNKLIYCYELGKKYNSVKDANNENNIKGNSLINDCLNNPNKTAGGYHWCTDLSVFDGVELFYPSKVSSSYEHDLLSYINSLGSYYIIKNDRSVLNGKELDLYIPEKKLAIEFNGDYWHSEIKKKDTNYHQRKTLKCMQKGINLIQIFEFDWINNSEIYKNLICTKLGVLKNRVYARKCNIKEIDHKKFNEFLTKYHLQGETKTKYRLGLYYSGELLAVMGFNPYRDYYILNRFCLKSGVSVVGGAGKLLSYFEKKISPLKIVSYADLKHSLGNLYEKLGFHRQTINKPIYYHVKGREVLKRYGTSHRQLKIKKNFNYDENLTEFENMDRNGYLRIWTVGTITYVKRK